MAERMKKISYVGYRFPPEIIHQAIWLYLRFSLSLRDVEDLLADRGLAVSYETVRRWVNHFGPVIAADLRKHRQKPHTGAVTRTQFGRAQFGSPSSGSGRSSGAPSPERLFSEDAERPAGGEMALDVEGGEDSGVNGQEALG